MSTKEDWLNAECLFCGKKFHLKPSALKRFKTHYCSKSCQNEARKEYMKGEGNHQYSLKGRNNASWKSDVRESRYGYIEVRDYNHPFCDKNGWVFEHRVIAEQFLLTPENSIEVNGKMYLKREYEVHHKNFDRKDNRKENLEVMKHGEHRVLHNKLNPNKRNEKGQFVADEPDLIKVKKVTETAIIPKRQSIGSAGYDLFADIDEPIEIKPHETVMVQSNVAFEIPKNYFGAVYARSGLSTRQGLRPATCVSVIDSDYRGSVGLPIHNDTDETRVINPHERVAQIVFQRALDVELELVDTLEETERGDGGFGSSGKF
jgi:dUTP pyrophosphatase